MKRVYTILGCLFLVFDLSLAQTFEGYVLYNPGRDNTTYLIDKNTDIVHEWSCKTNCAYSAYLRPNGNIVRTGTNPNNRIRVAAGSGRVEEYAWNGDLLWEFDYSTDKYISHHDIAPMPNGNVLVIALEVKTTSEAKKAGRSDSPKAVWSPQIIEVAPDGNGGGKIVWQWNMWDHLVQDVDQSNDNYGVVKDHPELLDINLGKIRGGDWVHANGIDYNADLDQITFSSRLMSEVYIIDHSTTTKEAASHEGGNSGKGGDLLYRWGNPANYGAPGEKVILGAVHDAHWNAKDTPKPGYLALFNNAGGGKDKSVVDMLETPLDGSIYKLDKGESYAPKNKPTWRHEALKFAWGQSSSQLMPNGNLFVCINSGDFYEVDKDGNKIWEFSVGSGVAKAFRYAEDYVTNIQKLNGEEISFKVFPSPSTGRFNISGDFINKEDFELFVYDITGKEVKNLKNTLNFDLSSFENGFYFLKVKMKNKVASQKIILQK